MKYIEGEDRTQITLLPDSIEEYVSEDNPVRVIDAFVNSLDMEALGFKRSEPNITGRPSYDPRDLLKLYIYGYFNKIRSSRKLMQESNRNVEVMYLLGKLVPDFRTIADFRKDNPNAITNVFKAFVKVCVEANLYKREIIAIDGSKFRASNSKKNCYNIEVLDKKISYIETNLTEYLAHMDEEDDSDIEMTETTKEQIESVIKELNDRKKKYQSYKTELLESGEKQLLTTDPDARRMHSKDGFHCSYNVQTAVDDGSHLIAAYTVDSKTDVGHLKEVSDEARQLLGVEVIEALADKGYDSIEDVTACLMNGIVANPGIKDEQEERVFNIEYIENEIDEKTLTSTKPENIQKCLHAGVLPKCYEGKSVTVEYQKNDDTVLSCFARNDDNTVTCPMGKLLRFARKRKDNTVFYSKHACSSCTNKCTKSKHKTVLFGPNTEYVPIRMNYTSDYELPHMPEGIKLPNNFKKKSDKKVLIRIIHTKEMTAQRMCLSEHPFGTIKWYNLSHYLLCRRKEKVTAEIGLSLLAYNIRRAIYMKSVAELVEVM